jgi:hypothetical protein
MWTAALSKNVVGGAMLKSNDKSCTVPTIPTAGVDFRNSLFTEKDADGNFIDRSIARTTEGHFEVIEMGEVSDPSLVSAVSMVAGVPKDCTQAVNAHVLLNDRNSNILPPAPPSGGLYGTATLVNVGAGTSVSVDAEAFTEVYSVGKITQPDDTLPSLASATGVADFSYKGQFYSAAFADSATATAGAKAVSAVLMKSALLAEWIVEPALNAGTDIILSAVQAAHQRLSKKYSLTRNDVQPQSHLILPSRRQQRSIL